MMMLHDCLYTDFFLLVLKTLFLQVPSGSASSFVVQSVTSRGGLIDAVVFGDADLSIVEALIPGKKGAHVWERMSRAK